MSKKSDKRMNAFMINDLLKFNIDELVTFIEDNYPSVDISNIKRTYIHVEPNSNNLDTILINFIITKVNELNEGGEEIEECIKDNIDIFFDITKKTDDVYIVEKMTNN